MAFAERAAARAGCRVAGRDAATTRDAAVPERPALFSAPRFFAPRFFAPPLAVADRFGVACVVTALEVAAPVRAAPFLGPAPAFRPVGGFGAATFVGAAGFVDAAALRPGFPAAGFFALAGFSGTVGFFELAGFLAALGDDAGAVAASSFPDRAPAPRGLVALVALVVLVPVSDFADLADFAIDSAGAGVAALPAGCPRGELVTDAATPRCRAVRALAGCVPPAAAPDPGRAVPRAVRPSAATSVSLPRLPPVRATSSPLVQSGIR